MARGYLPARVRCNQLETIVSQEPGATVGRLVQRSGLSYQSVCMYMHRLSRERRVSVLVEDPALGAKALQRFYPTGAAPTARRRAA